MTEYVRLGDVATINPPKKEVANLDDDTIVGFLPMDAVSNGGAIERIDTRKYAEVKKGFVYFRDGDVLFAKITPCMENGKGAVVSGMPDGIGFGSTEFHVVRPNEEIIYGQYIHYFLKNPALRKVLENEMTGSAGQKRVSKDTLKELAFPLPSLEEQKRIAAALDKMSSVIAKRKRQIALLDEAAKSLFVEMFGDPVENPMGWEIVELRALGDGKDAIKCGPFGTQLSKSEYRTEGVPVWGIPEINSSFSKMPSDFVTPEKAEILDSYSVIPNDIVMSRKGTIGKCALYPKNLSKGIIHSDVLRIRPNSGIVNSYFLKYQLHIRQYIASQIEGVSNGAIMKGINVTKLKQILIHLPPLDLQNLFAARIEALEAQRASCERGLRQMETAFAAMMQEYFG